MTTAAVAVVLLSLLVLALERNHRRQSGPRPPDHSSDLPDPDAQRALLRDETFR